MAELRPLPPAASAEGESAALQTQIVDASTIEKKDVGRDHGSAEKAAILPHKKTEAGMMNYIVGTTPMLYSRLTWQSASSPTEQR